MGHGHCSARNDDLNLHHIHNLRTLSNFIIFTIFTHLYRLFFVAILKLGFRLVLP